MYSKKTVVANKTGFHARPAADLVLRAKEFKAAVTIRNLDTDNKTLINAKSIMNIMAAAIKMGTNIEIAAEGEDEVKAVEELVKLIESGFAE